MEAIISKENFVEIINELIKIENYSDDLNRLFKKHNIDGYLFQPDCNPEVVRLLHIMFGKLDSDEWISYFCYELDYGRKWEKGMITDKDGVDIPLSTPEELYDFLLSDNNIKKEAVSRN